MDRPAVALRGDELQSLADSLGISPGEPGDLFRALADCGALGDEAALCLTSPHAALVGDWVRGRVYEVEFDLFTDPLTESQWAAVRDALFEEWFELRTTWAAEGHLTDPELAAALRAFTRAALSAARLKPTEFRVGGKARPEERRGRVN